MGPEPALLTESLTRLAARAQTGGYERDSLGVGPTPSAARSQRDHHRDHAAARREQRGDERADQQRGRAHRSPTKAAASSPRHRHGHGLSAMSPSPSSFTPMTRHSPDRMTALWWPIQSLRPPSSSTDRLPMAK